MTRDIAQFFLYHGATAPSLPLPAYRQGFMITLRHTTLGSGRVLRPTQRPLPDNTQHSQQTDIHAPSRIRTHNPSNRAAADPRLRPRVDWNWPQNAFSEENFMAATTVVSQSEAYNHQLSGNIDHVLESGIYNKMQYDLMCCKFTAQFRDCSLEGT